VKVNEWKLREDEVIEMTLTRGKVALIDKADLAAVITRRWHAHFDGAYWSVASHAHPTLYLHRLLLDAPEDRYVDHINGDGLDNRRVNIRLATNGQNQWNSRKRLGTTSHYKGVHFRKDRDCWYARIKYRQRSYHIGSFESEQDAARAYNAKAVELFGEFARLNEV
jgi:hypothetical protein